MSFTKKLIEIRIILAKGEFSNKSTTKIIRGLPMVVDIGRAGLPARDVAKVSIFGIKQEDLEALTFLNFRQQQIERNILQIYAGDEKDGLSLVFIGEISNAYPQYNQGADVPLEIEALGGYYPAMIALPPYTFKGSIPAADIVKELAQKMEYTFIDEGETKSVLNPYLRGSALQQLVELARNLNLDLVISNGVVKLRKSDTQRKIVAVISKDISLIGYPSFTPNGVRIKSEYLPALELGDWIEIKSLVPKASGIWQVVSIHIRLTSDMSEGSWFTEIEAAYTEGY